MVVVTHWFTLKFSSQVSETGYLQSVAGDLLKGFRIGCLLSLIAALCFVVMAVIDLPLSRVYFICGQALLFVILGSCSLTPCILRCISLSVREVLVVCIIMAYMLVLVYSQVHYEHKLRDLLNLEFDTGMPYDDSTQVTDSNLLMSLSVCIAGVHLLLPIRWIVLLPLDIFCVMVYGGVVFILGSPENYPELQLLMLALTVCCSCLGKRRVEISQRLAFLDIATERSLRAMAEFKSMGDTPVIYRSLESSSEHATDTTTASARAVQQLYEKGSDVAAILEQIANIGAQEHWVVNPDDLKVFPDRILGNGSFGTVLVGKMHGTEVAVKLTHEAPKRSTHRPRELINELRVLRHVRHPNVAHFYGASIDTSTRSVALIMEFVHGNSLLRFIGDKPTREDRHSVSLQVARALRFLHSLSPPIIHGDVKPQNIVVEASSKTPTAKLVDFGLSRVLQKHVRMLGGSLAWMAPEVVQGACHGSQLTCADAYSFGLVFYFTLVGRRPFAGRDSAFIRSVQIAGVELALKWSRDDNISENCKEVCQQCVKVDPTTRHSMVYVYEQLEKDLALEESTKCVSWPSVSGACSLESALPKSIYGVFDAGKPQYPILGLTSSWVQFLGKSESIREILGDETYEDFAEWLQIILNYLYHSQVKEDKVYEYGTVRCEHISGRLLEATLAVRVLCEMVTGMDVEEEPAASGEMGTQLFFFDSCWVERGSSSQDEASSRVLLHECSSTLIAL